MNSGIRPLRSAALSFLALIGPIAGAKAQTPLWDAEGPMAGATMGRSLAAIDDLDGDGRKDLIVGLPGASWVQVLSGATGAVIHNFFGMASDDGFGASVANAGDVDNDNYSDVLVLAASGTGYAQVLSGRPGPVTILHTFTAYAGNSAELSVTGLGDLDGDGYDDVLVRDPSFILGVGRVVVYSGQTGAVLMALEGTPGSRFGDSMAGPGDVNGDGVPDILIGAPWHSDHRGQASVFSGVDGSVIHTFDGSHNAQWFGNSVAAAGDIDLDGYADIIVGSWGYSALTGRVSVFSGQTGALLHQFDGTFPTGGAGLGVAGAGDVDDDGVPDILVGAPFAGVMGVPNTGLAWVFSGSSGAPLAEIQGVGEGSRLGNALVGLGDVDGDGLEDFAVAAPWGDGPNGLTHSGRVEVFSAPTPGPAADPNLSTIAANPTSVGFLGESTITVAPKDALDASMGPGHQVFFKSTEGSMLGSVFDHGDGSYSQVAQAGLSAMPSTISVAVNGRLINSTAVVTSSSAQFVVLADSEIFVLGTHQQDFLATHTADAVGERLGEEESHGNPSSRTSLMEHKWLISVPATGQVMFFAKAYGSLSTDAEDFEFAYSLDDSTYFPMLTVDETAIGSYRTFALPSGTSGTVYVRVVDTDRTGGNLARDILQVDHLGIAIIGAPTTPPQSPSNLTATAVASSRINLAWTDNATSEAGFYVERSLDAINWNQVASLAANVTTHDDMGLAAATTYHYRVIAHNFAGNSIPSNIASDATLPGGSSADDVANGENAVKGTVSGDFIDTTAMDGVRESILERESGGRPNLRHSLLEHKWTVSVTGGTAVTFFVNAYHDVSVDGDDFVFAYSVDDNTYVDMLTVTKTAADNTYDSSVLPASISGTVYIRVRDTNRAQSTPELDAVYVDHMFVRSTN